MTQIDIAALVADREAGTNGPFATLTPCVDLVDEADARRMSRLDALETGYIEQAETIKRLQLAASAQENRTDALIVLLAEALPWVEAQLDDPVNKPGVVRAFANRIRAALGECK